MVGIIVGFFLGMVAGAVSGYWSCLLINREEFDDSKEDQWP
jgi:hypothetical protein